METWSGSRRVELVLDAFVPALVRRTIAGSRSGLQPAAQRFDAALLLTDISGFSSLAEAYARRGPRGAEDLKDVLNFFCGHFVNAVERHGGEVLRFAGDAALALWPADHVGVARAARAAAACAFAVRSLTKDDVPPHGERLSMRAGVGAGEVLAATVGGVEGRWDLIVAGEALNQAVRAAALVPAGEIGISAPTWPHIAPCAMGSTLDHAVYRLDRIADQTASSTRAQTPLPVDGESLRAFVPRSIQARLDAQQTDWIAEFRRVTALFIKLEIPDYGAPNTLDVLQRAIVAVQSTVYRYGGSINQTVVDDKGTVIVCAWGLALHAHGDDQMRAMRAALELRDQLIAAGIGASFGLATGDVFTGLLGTTYRCEFTMIGDTVNVASRLMEAAHGGILCDLMTIDGSSDRVASEAQPPIRVKGRKGLIDIFKLTDAAVDGGDMIGRVAERRAIRTRLDAVTLSNVGGVVILEGEPGIGKSCLVADVIDQAVAQGVRTMIAAGDSIERSTPYHVWSLLIDNLLGIKGHGTREEAERSVQRLLQSNPRLLPFGALLNPVLRLSLPATESSESVTPRGRADLTRELLVHLFRSTTGSAPTVLILEDAQWLDSGSWAVAEALARKMPELLLLIATRVMSREEQPQELARLAASHGTLIVHLEALAAAESRALACRRMRARAVTEPVAGLIRERAEGHPFFIEELVYALVDRGLVHVEDGVCRLTKPDAIDAVDLPNTVQVVVASRIDQLTMEGQLTIKVASIFGRTFSLDGLRAVYPIPIAFDELCRHVETLVEHRLVQPTSRQALSHEFKHAITQEVAYGLLPYEERRRLHAAAAAWYEEQHRNEDLVPLYPLLAHHWSRAEQAPRAIFYLERAGEQALKRHANEEAVRFLSEAVDIDERLGTLSSADQVITLGRHHVVQAGDASRAARACRLGDASTNLSRWEQGSRHFRNGLALAGFPLPGSNRELLGRIAAAIGVQGARRVGVKVFRPASGRAADLLQDAVGAYQRIGSIAYQEGRVPAVVYALISALNLAERLGPGAQFARVCADVGNVLGLVPLRPLARLYQRMAFRMADRLDDRVMAARVRARAAVYRLGVGEWEACRDLETAMALCDEIGDSYLWEENAAIRARAAQLRGDFELAARLGAEVRARAAVNRSVPHEIWGTAAEGWANLYLGRHQSVLQQTTAGLRLLSSGTTGDQVATLDFLGAMALAHLGCGDFGEARITGEQLMEAIRKVPRPGYFAVLGISAAVETGLAIWETREGSVRGIQAARHVQQALAWLDRYARVSPPARARALLWRGCSEWLQGSSTKALRTWKRCVAEAERFALPYELARAHYELGRRLERVEARRAHLVRAETEFRRMRADADLKRVAVALADNVGRPRP